MKWIITAALFDIAYPPTLRIAASFEGTEEEARFRFRELLNSYDGEARKVTSREVFKFSDNQYLVRVKGRTKEFAYMMQLGEQVVDTRDPELPDSVG
ncbi:MULTISPECIES: hypothetical protein [Streptomyces]|uniref:hypothetical protein n=1 Tax=Streptomyces TaxID=1883 RepID=UPI00211A1138|nr:hypothetical protein [Streptomyces hilarionis]MCQ9131145.1 hypothetical protein [Streptomyces hilarionis]